MGPNGRFREVVFCAMLGLSPMVGAPLLPEKIEELIHTMNQTTVAQTLSDGVEDGDDLIRKLLKHDVHQGG
jgi:hypothetical protein